MEIPKLDKTKLTPDQLDKLDAYYQSQDQLKTLQDVADMTHELINIASDNLKNTGQIEAIGAVLTDAREQLVELNKKEAPEAPDYSKPIVAAINKLENALKTPTQVNVDSPQVNVDAPDLTEFNQLLRTEIPSAFQKAIKSIPKVEVSQPDFAPLLSAWAGISDQLLSIETATRLKPQFPTTLKVTNPDGSVINTDLTYATQIKIDSIDTNISYIGKASIGSASTSAVWQVQKLDSTGGELIKTWADGNSLFDNIFNNRESISYS